MSRLLFCIAVVLYASACSIFDKEEQIPSFIEITEATLSTILLDEGAATHNITDVHVFANEQFVGTYEIPAKVAILEEGLTRLNINAGIKNNGLVSNRIIYPFYAPLIEEINLIPGAVLQAGNNGVVNFKYFNSGLIFFIEDFESVGTSLSPLPTSSTSVQLTTNPAEVRSGTGAGKVELTQENNNVLVVTDWQLPSLPRGRNMYLEIDFKGTSALEIGVYTTFPDVRKTFALGLVPQDEWTKVYVDLTENIAQQFPSAQVKLYFESRLLPGQTEATLLFDNIKFIFPQL